MSTEPRTWVNEKKIVRAFSGADRNETVAAGHVIAYQESPSVLIVDADGNRTWWAAHLCEVVETEVEAAARRLREAGFATRHTAGYAGAYNDLLSLARHVLNGGSL